MLYRKRVQSEDEEASHKSAELVSILYIQTCSILFSLVCIFVQRYMIWEILINFLCVTSRMYFVWCGPFLGAINNKCMFQLFFHSLVSYLVAYFCWIRKRLDLSTPVSSQHLQDRTKNSSDEDSVLSLPSFQPTVSTPARHPMTASVTQSSASVSSAETPIVSTSE